MKIDKIMKFMKMKKTCAVFPVDGTQWFSNGEAAFPIFNFPSVDVKTVRSLFSLDEDSEKGWTIQVDTNGPAALDLRDESLEGDEQVDLHNVSLSVGRQLTPVLTSIGMAFYKPEYIAPFLADKMRDYDFVIRWTAEDEPVLLIKRGAADRRRFDAGGDHHAGTVQRSARIRDGVRHKHRERDHRLRKARDLGTDEDRGG